MARALGNRWLVVLGAALSLSVAIVASCTFPEVSFTDVPTGSEGGNGEAGSPEGAAKDSADATGDAAMLEGSTRDDATAKIPDGSCGPENCDCDKDLFLRANCDSGTAHPVKLDCDDFDPLRKPGAGFSAEKPDPGQVPSGDWNCDGVVDKAYSVNVTCTGTLTGCRGAPGFSNDPSCGTAADYFECVHSGIGCALKKKDTRVQLCK